MAPGNPQEWNRGFHGNAPRIGPDVTAGRAPRSPPSARRGGGSGPAPSSRGTPHWWPRRSLFRARQWQRGVRAGGWDRARARRVRKRGAEAVGGPSLRSRVCKLGGGRRAEGLTAPQRRDGRGGVAEGAARGPPHRRARSHPSFYVPALCAAPSSARRRDLRIGGARGPRAGWGAPA